MDPSARLEENSGLARGSPWNLSLFWFGKPFSLFRNYVPSKSFKMKNAFPRTTSMNRSQRRNDIKILAMR